MILSGEMKVTLLAKLPQNLLPAFKVRNILSFFFFVVV
jgi:hypothetical protein